MRFFTRQFDELSQLYSEIYNLDEHKEALEWWDNILAAYERCTSLDFCRWSAETQKFHSQKIDFHDRAINRICIAPREVMIYTSIGTVEIKHVESMQLSGELDEDIWLYHEIVCPLDPRQFQAGLVEFNVLTECGEISMIARHINFTPSQILKQFPSE